MSFLPAVGSSEARFREALEREVLASERLRTTILAGVLAFGFAVAGLTLVFVQWQDVPLLNDRATGLLAMTVLAALIVYEFVVRALIDRWRARGTTPPGGVWYVNAFVETSTPTLILYGVAQGLSQPEQVLVSPVVWIYFAFVVLSTLRLNFGLCVFTGAVAAVEYLALALFLLSDLPVGSPIDTILQSRIIYAQKAIILLASGVTAGFVAYEIRRRVRRSFHTIEERDEVLRIFGQQTSPAIVEELLGKPEEQLSQRRDVCILFLDIRGFTSFSERREPEDVVAYLNTLFDFMIEDVNRHHGIIHQLLGDGFMAIFGAPFSHGNDCQHAVDAALSIVEHVGAAVKAGRVPPTRIGIGVHAGEVVAGTVGSAIHKEYKVTGDVVNLAARIEQLNKRFDTQLLISEAVRQRVRLGDRPVEAVGTVDVRGRREPVPLFQLA